jgi:hypothetical protein
VGTKNQWCTTTATIYSAEWIPPEGRYRGCWKISYSYWVNGEIYSGFMTDFATDSEVAYHKDDALPIEYSSQEPGKSRTPSTVSYWQKARLPFTFGAILGLIAIILYTLTHLQ